MRRPRRKLEVNTFPFLAVLLCAMGSFILLLMIMDRRAKIAAQHKARDASLAYQLQLDERKKAAEDARAQAQKTQDELNAQAKAQWIVRRDKLHAELKTEEDALAAQIAQAMAALARLDELDRDRKSSTMSLKQKIDLEDTTLRLLQKELAGRQTQLEQARQASQGHQKLREQMTRELVVLEAALKSVQDRRAAERPVYSLVPYKGKHGADAKPLYIEVAAGGLAVHPGPTVITGASLTSESFRKAIEERTGPLEKIVVRPGAPPAKRNKDPYVLFLVRPAGIPTYYDAMNALRDYHVDFGYELVEPDWVFDFGGGLDAQPWRNVAKIDVEPSNVTRPAPKGLPPRPSVAAAEPNLPPGPATFPGLPPDAIPGAPRLPGTNIGTAPGTPVYGPVVGGSPGAPGGTNFANIGGPPGIPGAGIPVAAGGPGGVNNGGAPGTPAVGPVAGGIPGVPGGPNVSNNGGSPGANIGGPPGTPGVVAGGVPGSPGGPNVSNNGGSPGANIGGAPGGVGTVVGGIPGGTNFANIGGPPGTPGVVAGGIPGVPGGPNVLNNGGSPGANIGGAPGSVGTVVGGIPGSPGGPNVLNNGGSPGANIGGAPGGVGTVVGGIPGGTNFANIGGPPGTPGVVAGGIPGAPGGPNVSNNGGSPGANIGGAPGSVGTVVGGIPGSPGGPNVSNNGGSPGANIGGAPGASGGPFVANSNGSSPGANVGSGTPGAGGVAGGVPGSASGNGGGTDAAPGTPGGDANGSPGSANAPNASPSASLGAPGSPSAGPASGQGPNPLAIDLTPKPPTELPLAFRNIPPGTVGEGGSADDGGEPGPTVGQSPFLRGDKAHPGPRLPSLGRITGNRDFVLTIECYENSVSLTPPGRTFDLTEPNSIDQLHKLTKFLVDRRQATVRPGEPPYRPIIHFRVQPDGRRTYYSVYPRIAEFGFPMSRDSVD